MGHSKVNAPHLHPLTLPLIFFLQTQATSRRVAKWSPMVAMSGSGRQVSEESDKGGDGICLTGEDERQTGCMQLLKLSFNVRYDDIKI